ncbi:MAG: hypothetical protein HFJ51_04070 [Clostridia bacterium]|nr:hypothetical protein [Clostridia bacterium]
MLNNFDIQGFITDFSKACSKTQIKTFSKGEVITTYLVNRNQLCILISGSADLVRYDINRKQACDRALYKKLHLWRNFL